MKRAYNNKISEKANISLSKREEKVRIQKILIGIAAIIIISLVILLGTSISAFASLRTKPQPLYKYYTSIEVQSGDTLWGIADEYTQGTDVVIDDYIDEVCQLNHISGKEIHSGEYLVVSYYSTEEK